MLLLTGTTGFLGSHLLKHWIDQGREVVALKRSTSSLKRLGDYANKCRWYDADKAGWQKAFTEQKITAVVHIAASYGRKGESLSEVFQANTVLPLQLLELSIAHNVEFFLNTASSLPRTLNAYSLSKAQFYDWLQFHTSRIRSANLALEYFYGPGDDDWKFLTMVVRKLLKEEEKIDFTEGVQKRDFIYVQDVVLACDWILQHHEQLAESTAWIPVGTGKSHSLRQAVEMCKKLVGNTRTHLNFGGIPGRPGEAPELKADIEALDKLGWQPRYSLAQGLKKMIEQEKYLMDEGITG